jgi:Holliday junction resolvase
MSRTFHLPEGFAAEQTHANLIRELVRYLRLRGFFVVVTPRGGIKGEPGLPDIIAFKGGRTVFVEAKIGRDKLSAEQLDGREQLTRQGFEYIEARSLADVITAGV